MLQALLGQKFELVSERGQGSQASVYQVRYKGQFAALKLHHSPGVDTDSHLRFKREASWLACLNHPLLPKVLEIGQLEGHPYLLMEYIEGKSLSEHLQKVGLLSEPALLDLARELAGTLRVVHQHGFVHCDIKPENIVLDTKGQARLIDFGIAQHLESQSDSSHFVGSLPYAAPEQAGMLVRPIDARADLYSLGVVFFQCLTGQLPFTLEEKETFLSEKKLLPAPEVLGLAPHITKTLSNMIARLLASDPDDRYVSASELVLDLSRIEELEEWQDEESALLGSPSPELLREELPLIGRVVELESLQHEWGLAQKGHSRTVLIEGHPGAGKSRLIREFLREAHPPFFGMGKCVEKAPTTLGPLRRILTQFFAMVARLPKTKRLRIEQELREELAPLATFLYSLSPTLGPYLPPMEASLFDEESREHFLTAIASLFTILARAVDGMIVFIDDIQWLDSSTFEVLDRLAHDTSDSPLMLLLTSRHDPESLEQLEHFKRRCGDVIHRQFELELFTKVELQESIQNFLHQTKQNDELSDFLFAKSQGNPFALHQLLRALLDMGFLYPEEGCWKVETVKLSEFAFPSEIVQIILYRVEQQAEVTNQLLSIAALLNGEFESTFLGEISKKPHERIVESISEATSNQLIERTGQGYRFIHDRIHEAFLERLSDEERQAIHLSIAELLVCRIEEGDEHLFACAYHFAQSNSSAHAQQIFDVCLRAGLKARASFDEDRAIEFLKAAEAIADAEKMPPSYELFEALSTLYMRLKCIKQAQAYQDLALPLARGPVALARIYGMQGEAFLAFFQKEDCEEALKKGLLALGERPPSLSPISFFLTFWLWLVGIFSSWLPKGKNTPEPSTKEVEKEHERFKVLSFIYEQLSRLYYFQLRDFLIIQIWIRLLTLIQGRPPSSETVGVHNTSCAFSGIMLSLKNVERYHKKALALAKGEPHLTANVHIFHCWGIEFTGRVPEVYRLNREVLDNHGQWLAPFEWTNSHNSLGWAYMSRGRMADAELLMRKALQKISQEDEAEVNFRPMATTLSCLAVALHSMGQGAEAQHCIQRAKAIADEDMSDRHVRSFVLAATIWIHFERADFNDTFEALCEEHASLQLVAWRIPIYLKYFYVFQGMARAHQCQQVPKAERAPFLAKCTQALKPLKQVAFLPVFKPFLFYVQGVVAVLQEDDEKAKKLFNKAESLAIEWENPLLLCEIACQRARIARRNGAESIAVSLVLQGQALCLQHNWALRLQRIQQEFTDVFRRQGTQLSGLISPSTGSMRERNSLKFSRQLNTLLQINLATATKREPDSLARIVLDEVLRLFGAERAFLFLLEEGALELVASRDTKTNETTEKDTFYRPAVAFVQAHTKSVVLGGRDSEEAIPFESTEQGIRSIIASPLMIADQLLGVLYLDNRFVGGLFERDDVEILQALANHVAVAFTIASTSRELVTARDLALRADQVKSSFLSTMSHELRTPLNAILGYAELMLENHEDKNDSENSDLLAIQKAGRQLLNIINEVLTYVQLESGDVTQTPSRFSVSNLLEELVSSLSPLLQESENQIELSLPPEEDSIVMDREACFRMLQPVLKNALQFTRKGTIFLRVSITPKEVGFEIEDTGMGMKKEDLAEIFTPFYQADMSYARAHGGIGMGLTVSRRFCEELGGTMQVTSTPGVGSCFRLQLPQQEVK